MQNSRNTVISTGDGEAGCVGGCVSSVRNLASVVARVIRTKLSDDE